MIRLRFWLRIAFLAAKERLFGIFCPCGAHTFLPAKGWHFGTFATGDSRWHCPDCWYAGAEGPLW